MKKALIVSAEPSADSYSLAVLEEFRKRGAIRFFGVGGDRLQNSGVEILIHNRRMSIVGIVEVLFSLLRMRRYLRRLTAFARTEKMDFALLVDFPDFNLRLARRLHRAGIPVFYYISPTVWAWRYRRVRQIKRWVTHMFLIFPFEREIYRGEAIPHTYVGHPLKRRVHSTQSGRDRLMRELKVEGGPLIGILPGSRHSEIKRHMGVMVKAMENIHSAVPDARFVVLKADHIPQKTLEGYLKKGTPEVRVVAQDRAYDLMRLCRAVIASCGTSNLEIGLLGTPFCAVYRVNPLSYWLGKGLLNIDLYSIVNILAGKQVIREFIQSRCTARALAGETLRMLKDTAYRDRMTGEFQRISDLLSEERNPAMMIVDTITELTSGKGSGPS